MEAQEEQQEAAEQEGGVEAEGGAGEGWEEEAADREEEDQWEQEQTGQPQQEEGGHQEDAVGHEVIHLWWILDLCRYWFFVFKVFRLFKNRFFIYEIFGFCP